MEITINDYKFQLIKKYDDVSYPLIKIKNVTLDITFYVYQSNSEGGIFRLCTRDTETHLFKGDNYITATIISLDLQKFIFDNLKNIPKGTNLSGTALCPLVDKEYVAEYTLEKYINRRILEEPYFKLFTHCQCGESFIHVYELMTGIANMYADNLKNSSIDQTVKKYITDNLEVIMNYINDICKNEVKIELRFNYNKTFDKFKAYQQKLESTKQHMKYDTKIKLFRKFMLFLSDYFAYISIIVPNTNTFLYEYTFKVPKIPDIVVTYQIYSIDIEIKLNKKRYRVYYGRYLYNNNKQEHFNGNYDIIINILPVKGDATQTNRYGVYRGFMNCGMYICKILDYIQQIKTIEKDIDDGNRIFYDTLDRGAGTYTFIGDLYSHLYPQAYISYQIEFMIDLFIHSTRPKFEKIKEHQHFDNLVSVTNEIKKLYNKRNSAIKLDGTHFKTFLNFIDNNTDINSHKTIQYIREEIYKLYKLEQEYNNVDKYKRRKCLLQMQSILSDMNKSTDDNFEYLHIDKILKSKQDILPKDNEQITALLNNIDIIIKRKQNINKLLHMLK